MADATQKLLVVDLVGQQLTTRERALLVHPAVAGLILFSRNFVDRQQVCELVKDIRVVNPSLLIMVDQEGGRVQRFRSDGFSRVPAMGLLGKGYKQNPDDTLTLMHETGWLLASELRATDIDLGLSPILDLDRGISRVIGDRGFSSHPDHIVALAGAFIEGMHEAGMSAVGKHFPGHGGVEADSHISLPVDKRSPLELQADLKPYRELIPRGLDGVMPAHVRYPSCDDQPAGFSSYWLQTVLREEMNFQGAVFSDCLSMAGARVAGTIVERVEAAVLAGCDLALVCNSPDKVDDVIRAFDTGTLAHLVSETRDARLAAMAAASKTQSWQELLKSERRSKILEQFQKIIEA